MSALLTKAFEKWVAECAASNLPARPDAIIFALMEREPTREDNTVPEEKITYAVNELTYGQLNPNNIVCSAVVPDDCAFSYDWICLIHQASGTLCGVIKTSVQQKVTGESLIRNFTIIYSGIAQAAQITVPPQSWQVDITPELKSMLKAPNRLSEIAAEGEEAQQESRDNLGLKGAALLDVQSDIYDRTAGRLALPGAFGYGHLFSSSEVVYFSAQNGPAEFLKWVFEVTPGRYAVTQYGGSGNWYNPIIAYDGGNVYFRGLVDIEIRSGMATNGTESNGRWVTFHGDAEYTGQHGEGPAKYQVLVTKSMSSATLPGAWSRLFWSRDRLRQLLCAGDTTSQRAPQPGSLVLAAYLPDSGSSDVALLRVQAVPGSRLRQVVFEAEYRSSGFSAAARSFVYGSTLPGTYFALSGGPDVTFYNRGLVSLFVRAT
ncbi:TPA: phage tail protein [Escherichia coli]|uniref:phage tail-collar fiber domain-containing protein n=2 Tax=Escherichia coli TaxID=562 RepID=UPI0012FE654E|nr:phage tail protein [Escherichia coli]EHK8924039.1 phage tail protein [Escherichia coli]EHQ8922134.1 phage tail protein [Escherichia coli]EIG7946289.1 phage tail protein [Escherichia coli]EIH5172777.1 phage tail protein [Escherichia coli]EIH5177664.1 phage tail protein [Escherichia coli]